MRVLICGSRHFNDYERFKKEVMNALPVGDYIGSTVISGHAKGADTLGEQFARDMGLQLQTFPADWNVHGRAAGPIRNTQMLQQGKPDIVIAFLAENSRGTKNMINQAEKAGVPVKVIEI